MQTALSALPKGVPVAVNFPHTADGRTVSQQISILKQPCEPGISTQLPPMNHSPLIINQVYCLGS